MFAHHGYPLEIKFIHVNEKFNINNSIYSVLDLKYFSKLMSTEFQNAFKELSTYDEFKDNTVVVEFFESRKNKLTKEQINLLHMFIDNEEIIANVAKESIYKYYAFIYPHYFEGATLLDGHSPEIEEWLPKIVKGTELDNKIRLYSIIIYPSFYGKDKIALVFHCSWDDEHGLGVLLEGVKILKVGIVHDVSPPFSY